MAHNYQIVADPWSRPWGTAILEPAAQFALFFLTAYDHILAKTTSTIMKKIS